MGDIKLSGGEISVLKAVGFGGSQISGKQLLEKVEPGEDAEFIETLSDLILLGYIDCSRMGVRSREDVEKANFRLDPSQVKELRDAVNPSRSRTQDRGRRQRRS